MVSLFSGTGLSTVGHLPAHLATTDAWHSLCSRIAPGHEHVPVRVEVVVDNGAGQVLMAGGPGSESRHLPSTSVTADEAPGQAMRRVVTDLALPLDGRLLLMRCHHDGAGGAPALTLTFDGGTSDGESSDVARGRPPGTGPIFLDPGSAADPALADRIDAALKARNTEGKLPSVWHGTPMPEQPSSCVLTDELLNEHFAWELSETALRVDRSVSWPVTIADARDGRLVLDEDEDTVRPVTMGVFWQGGHAELTPAVSRHDGQVHRTVARLSGGHPAPGARAYMDSHVYGTDPMDAHGIPFEKVAIDGKLGVSPAWLVKPDGVPSTWVIAVHGRGATRREALRVLPTLTSAGTTTLVIGYRNDPDCPESPDAYTHLGDTEWEDVARAVRYAHACGAASVVLYGWSMGAMLALTALRRMPPREAALISGIVADCPVLDWDATFTAQALRYGVPEDFVERILRHIEWRGSLSLAELSQTDLATTLTVPMLLFVDTADRTVPPRPALELARARPGLITLMTSAAGHGRGWNQEPAVYEAAVRSFLSSVA
ncbi:alpha/beta hydrolase family protein [Streptomyces sp. NPDC058369]|uniref:alpha/beta hydrolase family protein n=2 Tax=unclassified Streptomyces TaxID=2593676 RepID=UPI00364DC15E